MANRPLPSPEVLRQLLRYHPETGKLFWRERGPEWFRPGNTGSEAVSRNWNGKYAGSEAFTATSHGYLAGRIFDRRYQAHRVVWAVYYGEWPKHEVDHINGDRKDNRIGNLRDVTTAENGKNKRLRSDNTSGYPGVSWSTAERKWKVLIWKNGNPIFRGTFARKKDAVKARYDAEKELGFHENHGRPT